MDIKKLLAGLISFSADVNFEQLIVESASADKGDYSLPSFSLSKLLHDSPTNIANKLLKNIKQSQYVEKVENVNGYLNFYLNKQAFSSEVLDGFNKNNFKLSDGKNKTVCVDYAGPNLAKYLHIGHLKTIVVGESLARLYTQCGYNVKRLSFTGDYGTPFGKIVGGILRFGSMEDVLKRGNDALQEYYVKFNQKEAEDESWSQYARDIFKKIEEKDAQIYPIYQKVIEIGLEDQNKIFNSLGVEFDDYRGEMYYNQLVPQLKKDLKSKKLLKKSEGAEIVELGQDIAPAVITKSDGTTLYLTRDIAAAIDRYKDYKFDNLLYVTGVEQVLHFKQIIEVLKLMKLPYAESLEHVPYGRFSLPEGKISSRLGKQAIIKDLLAVALEKAQDVISGRSFSVENPTDVANKVARAVLNFNVLKVERIKDCVFDMEKAFTFDGETAPYMQYTYTRLESLIRKSKPNRSKPDYSCFNAEAFELVKDINNFTSVIRLALTKRDSSIVCKNVMDMCKIFNKFYTTTKILEGSPSEQRAKLNLVKSLKETLAVGFNLICVDTLREM